MQTISAKIEFLVKYHAIPPQAFDAIYPHGPAFKSKAIMEYLMAGIVRDISVQIADRELAARVKAVGADMVRFAGANLINGYEDDDICPPYWPHPPFPSWHGSYKPQPQPWFQQTWMELNPQPLPPKGLSSALNVIAKYTSLPETGKQLSSLANKVGQLRG